MKQFRQVLPLVLATTLALLALAGCTAQPEPEAARQPEAVVADTPIPAPVLTPTPAPTPEPTPEPTPGPLAGCAGTYAPDKNSRSAFGAVDNVTLDENGVVTAGDPYFSLNKTPASVKTQDDGSIRVSFNSDEWYTVYPAEGKLEYYYCDGGVMLATYYKQ